MSENADGDMGYSAFVAASWARYLRIAVLLTGDRHRAEELLQDSLVKLYVHWRRIIARGDPDAYVHRMLVNGNVSWWRRRRREHLVADAPERADPGGAADHHEQLHAALCQLPYQQRAVVVLRHYLDLSEREVARILGVSVGTVKTHNTRALHRLRELLAWRETGERETIK